VPSDKVLQRCFSEYKVDTLQPGIISRTLNTFCKLNEGKFGKMSIDGKKIRTGFGKRLGDENLAGHEIKPTLEERKERYSREINAFDELVLDLRQLSHNCDEPAALETQERQRVILELPRSHQSYQCQNQGNEGVRCEDSTCPEKHYEKS
jgi:hypothetical protein